MDNIPSTLRYTKTHEWVALREDGLVDIGITAHAQQLLGDIVFVELPEDSQRLEKDKECAVIESVKSASDIYSPIAGVVVEVNANLSDSPELINQSPYEDGWLIRIKPDQPDSISQLLSAEDYKKMIQE